VLLNLRSCAARPSEPSRYFSCVRYKPQNADQPNGSTGGNAGKGVIGKIDNRQVAVGNAKLLKDLGVNCGNLEGRADELRREGATAMFVAVDRRPGGIIAVADPIKATTPAALASLRADGVRIVMLTEITARRPRRSPGSSALAT
jgi:cation transport ATPase